MGPNPQKKHGNLVFMHYQVLPLAGSQSSYIVREIVVWLRWAALDRAVDANILVRSRCNTIGYGASNMVRTRGYMVSGVEGKGKRCWAVTYRRTLKGCLSTARLSRGEGLHTIYIEGLMFLSDSRLSKTLPLV